MKHIIISCIILFTLITPSYGFWGNTHQRIGRATVLERKTLLDAELRKIGFGLGIEETFKGGGVRSIIESGSITEDDGLRFLNHFFNPLDGSGLYDIFTGYSSYVWANDINSGWSWRNTRNSFYLGITSSSDTERRAALAASFRALGQVMHLIQDKAVPAHVRNDGHMRPDGFEAYASENVDSLKFTATDFSGPKHSLRSYSPWQLWDSDQYDGTNPSTSTNLGLAEYTNANFASEDTIFTEDNLADWIPLNEDHYFPYPRREDTVFFAESQDTTWNGFEVYRKYFEKVGGGQTIKHFATASRLYAYLLDDPDPSLQGLDDRCHKDYADLLIPRAVGYSAALIDYFFRGQLKMEPDPSNSSQYVIKNESEENMSGTFSLYYDDKEGKRRLVAEDAEWELSIQAKGSSPPVSFDAPDDAKEAGKYMLVFQGRLGAEEEAVVGKFIQFDEVLNMRVVTVSNYLFQGDDHRGEIKVFTKEGQINGELQSGKTGIVMKVHFNLKNYDEFAILTKIDNFYEIQKYKIDIENMKIIYDGPLYNIEYEDGGSDDKLVNTECINHRYDCVGEECNDVPCISYFDLKLHRHHYKNVTPIDFYFQDDIKVFGKTSDSVEERLIAYVYNCEQNGRSCNFVDSHSGPYINIKQEERLFYGDSSIASSLRVCDDGYFEDTNSYRACIKKRWDNINLEPLLIFNESDYAYQSTNYKTYESSIITTLPYDLSGYFINKKNPLQSLRSIHRDGNSYSFSLYPYFNLSFSSELGMMDCGSVYLTDVQKGDRYVAYGRQGFVALKTCTDYSKLQAPYFSIGSDEVFEIAIR